MPEKRFMEEIMAPSTYVFSMVRDLSYATDWSQNMYGRLLFPRGVSFFNVGQEIILSLNKLKENIILYVHRIVENSLIEMEFFGGYLEGDMHWYFYTRPYGTLFEITSTIMPPSSFSKKLKWNTNGKKSFEGFFQQMLKDIKNLSEVNLSKAAQPITTY